MNFNEKLFISWLICLRIITYWIILVKNYSIKKMDNSGKINYLMINLVKNFSPVE